MFEGDSTDMCKGKFLLIEGRAEGPLCADLGARTPISMSQNFGKLVRVKCVQPAEQI